MEELSKVSDYMKVYEGFIPSDLCKKTVKELRSFKDWVSHYYENKEDYISYGKQEPQMRFGQGLSDPWAIDQKTIAVLDEYQNDFDAASGIEGKLVTEVSSARYNKYPVGSLMRPHFDAIHTLFDGQRKGVPLLSVIGALNDDYEGGALVFNGVKEITLKAGSILVFPSTFLYPHEIKPITKGVRYSFVSWAW